jgi:hypothetical protein
MRIIRKLSVLLTAGVLSIAFTGTAIAQSGHFLDRTVTCRDIGTQVLCTGKVAGLGGTTFRLLVQASGNASIECENQGGNVAPGQDTTLTALGDSGRLPTPRNGSHTFSQSTAPPIASSSLCPNDGWTATVVDVTFTTCTIQLFEDDTLSDSITVTVQ